jgi:hypothetical protein
MNSKLLSSTVTDVMQMLDGGIQHGYLGHNYQFKLLELFAHSFVQSGIKFELYTELSNAGKFDDLTLKVIGSDGISRFIFGQAKHKKTPEYLSFSKLIFNKDFQISCYFDSLNEVEQFYGNIESVLLITNNIIDDCQYKKQPNGLVKLNKYQPLYLIQDTSNHLIFANIGKRFKFPGKEHPIEHQAVLEAFRCDFVAKELVELFFGYTSTPKICCLNRKFLFGKIFDESKQSFRDEVLNGSDASLYLFRLSYEHAFKDALSKLSQPGSKKNYWSYWGRQSIEDKLKLIEPLSDADRNLDQQKFDFQLNRFIEKFILVTSLTVEKIEESIQADMRNNRQLDDVSLHYQVLTTSVKDWFTGPNKSTPLCKEIYTDFFKTSELQYKKKNIMDSKALMFKKLFFEFKSENSEIRSFLDGTRCKQILHVITPELEELLISMSIYSMLSSAVKDSFIMLKTNLSEEDIEQGLNIFSSESFCNLLVLQTYQRFNLLEKFARKCMDTLVINKTKRMIVISDENWNNVFQNARVINTPKILLRDLSKQSLDNVLKLEVQFQNSFTNWKNLLDQESYLEKSLADLLYTKSIAENVRVTKEYNQDLYVSRTFIFKNVLKTEVLKKCGNDEIVYNEQDFADKSKFGKCVHWLEQVDGNLKWIKSSGDICNIRKFIDEKTSEIHRESKIISLSAKIMILIDEAGMGKTTVLNYLAHQLKIRNPNSWIMKIDVHDYTYDLDELKPDELKTSSQAIRFLIEKIFKLRTELERNLCRRSCNETGNVILLFDGYDEVPCYYKHQLLQFIKSLHKTSIQKIFIASKPEWANHLEEEFLQIKHSMFYSPFSKEDQEKGLLVFMKERIKNADEDLLKRSIKTILELMSKSLSYRDYKFSGGTLIRNLVGEYFEPKFRDYFVVQSESSEEFIANLETASFNLCILYNNFMAKKLEKHFEENGICDQEVEQKKFEILMNYKKIAVENILKSDLKKYFPSFEVAILDKEKLEVLRQVGLIRQERKFYETFGEWCLNRFLDDHFNDEDCSKFIVEVVLEEESYKIIRFFMNFWILKKESQECFRTYQKRLLDCSEYKIKTTPLHIAGREGNANIFWFLYLSLTKGGSFQDKKGEIEEYLMKRQKYDYTAFVNYFCNCHDTFNILDNIKISFGIDFMKKIFSIEFQGCKEKFLLATCQSDKNLLKILKFLRENFTNHLIFLRQVYLSTDQNRRNFLHYALSVFKNENLGGLFEELHLIKFSLGADFIVELILSNEYGKDIVLWYSKSKHFDNEYFVDFLNHLKNLCGDELINVFFKYRKSQKVLHEICSEVKDFNLLNLIQWVNNEFGKQRLKKLILLENHERKTIFHNFSLHQANSGRKFLSILRFLKNDLKLENEFLIDEVLFNFDISENNVFTNLISNPQEIDFYYKFFEFLENDLNLTDNDLRKYLIKSKFLYFWISQIKEKSCQSGILDWFQEKFGNSFLRDNFCSVEFLHEICVGNPELQILNFLNFIEELTDYDFFQKYVSAKNSKSQTILFNVSESILIAILKLFITKFDRGFMENFLLQIDENLNSFLIFILMKCWDDNRLNQIFTEVLTILIANFHLDFVKQFLIIENDEKQNCLNVICRKDISILPAMLDQLWKKFQNDTKIIKTLMNEDLRQNLEIQTWLNNHKI